MRNEFSDRLLAYICLGACLFALPGQILAHGSVTSGDDLCLIRIGYYSAHFKIYSPSSRQHEQFCEDLPNAGEAVFVMEYGHSGLAEVPIDFKIVRNTTGQGRFARLADIGNIADLEAQTVYHSGPGIQPDVFTAAYDFPESGDFIGIVTINDPRTGETYSAVFPFKVGFRGFGYWPLFALLGLLLQLNYLWMTGWFAARSWRGLWPRRWLPVVAAASLAMFPVAKSDADNHASEGIGSAGPWISASGNLEVTVEPQLTPVVINRMHSWIIEIRSTAGAYISDATITVSGGMPAHDHGLATQPRVTQALGNGRYLLEGLRFHMQGAWQLQLEIEHRGIADNVLIEFEL